jgi:hypothetical protein
MPGQWWAVEELDPLDPLDPVDPLLALGVESDDALDGAL